MPEALPDRGIFFWVTPLPPPVVGFAEPFAPLEQARRQSSLAGDLQRRAVRSAAVRRLQIPEVTTGGELFRCAILLDPNAFSSGLLSERELMWLIRHETGHCLGFVGHVPRGVMTAVINGLGASMTITPDVRGMMQRLYRLPPGTEVVP
jgi:hypothetical protein